MEMREEDMDCLLGRITSDSDNAEDSEDDLSVPESNIGQIEQQNFKDIVQDVSKLFTEDIVDNNYQDGLQGEKDSGKEVGGRAVTELT